ncbi:MAG: 50S ribosomal protein L29 [Opitutales bacterium]
MATKTKDLRQLTVEELGKEIRDAREELVKLRMRKQSDQIERPSTFRELRRSIARLETILAEKKRAEKAA